MFRSGGWDGIIKSPYFIIPPGSSWCANLRTSLTMGRQLCRLVPNGVDDLIHTGHPGHAGKDNIHAGVVLLHRTGSAAVPYHDTIVVLVSGIPQAAFDYPGGGVSREEQRGHPKAAQV